MLTAPLMETDPHGFRDYALLFADEATIMTMLQNSRRIAQSLIHGRVIVQAKKSIDAKPKRHPSRHGVLTDFAPQPPPRRGRPQGYLRSSRHGHARRHQSGRPACRMAGLIRLKPRKHDQHFAFDKKNNDPLPNRYRSALPNAGRRKETVAITTGETDGLTTGSWAATHPRR
jgi:hypothetical protein